MASRIRTAVFPVAGLGTRFLPVTKSIPKEMLPLIDRPLIQYAIDEARAAGITDFVFVTARGKGALEDYFDAAPELARELRDRGKDDLLADLESAALPPAAVASVRQQEALGLGHAVWCARRVVGDAPFAVVLPDDVITGAEPCLAQMVEAQAQAGGDASILAAMQVPRERIKAYGVLEVAGEEGRLIRATGLVEKPDPEDAPSSYAVIGRYILSPRIMERLARTGQGAGGEIQLTDALAAEAKAGAPVYGYRFRGTRYDCGAKLGYLQALVAFALERADLSAEFSAYLKEIARDL